MGSLTCTTLINLLRCDGKNGKNFNHDFNNQTCHSRGRWYLNISLESSKNVFYPLNYVDKYIQGSTASVRGLRDLDNHASRGEKKHTATRVKTTTGGYAFKVNIREMLGSRDLLRQ